MTCGNVCMATRNDASLLLRSCGKGQSAIDVTNKAHLAFLNILLCAQGQSFGVGYARICMQCCSSWHCLPLLENSEQPRSIIRLDGKEIKPE